MNAKNRHTVCVGVKIWRDSDTKVLVENRVGRLPNVGPL